MNEFVTQQTENGEDSAISRFLNDMAERTGEISEMAIQFGVDALTKASGGEVRP